MKRLLVIIVAGLLVAGCSKDADAETYGLLGEVVYTTSSVPQQVVCESGVCTTTLFPRRTVTRSRVVNQSYTPMFSTTTMEPYTATETYTVMVPEQRTREVTRYRQVQSYVPTNVCTTCGRVKTSVSVQRPRWRTRTVTRRVWFPNARWNR